MPTEGSYGGAVFDKRGTPVPGHWFAPAGQSLECRVGAYSENTRRHAWSMRASCLSFCIHPVTCHSSIAVTLSNIGVLRYIDFPSGALRAHTPTHASCCMGTSLTRNRRPPPGPSQGPMHRPACTVGSQGGAVSYERGTPVPGH